MLKECQKCYNKFELDKFEKISNKLYSVWCINCYLNTYGEEYKDLIIIKKKDKESKYIKNSNKRKKKYWNEFDYYSEEVKKITEENKNMVKDIEKRNYFKYHLDHKISIKSGFDNSIPPEFIAHPTNLQILESKLNLLKNSRNIIDQDNNWIWLLFNQED
jgi:hypothetical protein